ncbi:MAG TPA: signal peptidase I [candidate division Zixibacteria bacterium]|nr:signal peptidase I [candidate division Zixibacteria bacterium]
MIEKPRKKKKKFKKLSRTQEILRGVILVVIIGTILRLFVFSPFRMDSKAMQSALYPGDFLLTSKLSYKSSKPQAGDLVLFTHPLRLGEKMVRRVVATEGQSVEIKAKIVYVDGQPFREFPNTLHSDTRILPREYSNRDYMPRQQVPPGQIFVLGDNRDDSEDSRNFGCVAGSSVESKALFVYFSWAPDPDAPKLKPPYIIPAIQLFFYNIYSFPSRVRWDRLFI